MHFMGLDLYLKKLFLGNLVMVVCGAFYLAWWIVAFRPKGASGGRGTGWTGLLLFGAIAAGIVSIVFMARGISTAPPHTAAIFPGRSILWGGIAVYFILLAVTCFLLKRQVTTELFLIVGWAMLELSAINAMYGTGRFGMKTSVLLIVVIGVAVLVSMVCYLLYYKLEAAAGYVAGMIPLIADAAAMACVAAATAVL